MARLRVEVVYALAQWQQVVPLRLDEGSTVGEAVAACGLAAVSLRFGIGGRKVRPDQVLRDGDRVELLRPLALDPKEARRRRARAAPKSRKR